MRKQKFTWEEFKKGWTKTHIVIEDTIENMEKFVKLAENNGMKRLKFWDYAYIGVRNLDCDSKGNIYQTFVESSKDIVYTLQEVLNDIGLPLIETNDAIELRNNIDEIERFENMSEKEKANECFTAYYPMAKFIYPRLKYFRNMDKMGYPSTLNSMEEWNDILDKMLFSFDYSINGDEDRFSPTAFTSEGYQNMLNRVNEGFELFGKYFLNLWD